jgi:hypothetical protein
MRASKTYRAGLETESPWRFDLDAMVLGSITAGLRRWPMERLRPLFGLGVAPLLSLTVTVARRRRPLV